MSATCCSVDPANGALTVPVDTGFPSGSMPTPSITAPNRLRRSGGFPVGFPVPVNTVANRPKDVAIRPVLQLPGGGKVGGHERPDRHGKVLADIEAARERAGL